MIRLNIANFQFPAVTFENNKATYGEKKCGQKHNINYFDYQCVAEYQEFDLSETKLQCHL